MPSPVPTTTLERELDLAAAVGAIVGYELTDAERVGQLRRFTLYLPGGRRVTYGPVAVEAFCLAVRILAEADDDRTADAIVRGVTA